MTNKSRGELVPGGLAIIISGGGVGNQVEIIRLLVDDRNTHILGKGQLSRGDCDFSLCAVVEDRNGERGLYLRSDLMPINPEADPLDITEQMECKA